MNLETYYIINYAIDSGDKFQLKDVILHFSQIGIIPPKVLRNYMIINDFDKFLVDNGGHIGNTFIDISVKYNLSENKQKI